MLFQATACNSSCYTRKAQQLQGPLGPSADTYTHSHIETHTLTHIHTHTRGHTHIRIPTNPHSLSYTHSCTLSHTLTFHTPPCTIQSLTHSCTYTLTPHKHTPSHMLSHKYTLIHTHTHTLVLKNEFIQLPWTLWNNTCGLFSVPRRTF